MSQVPNVLKYANTHEWARVEDDGTVTVGITDHAQSLLGDIVFIELPEMENDVTATAEAGVVESVKAASDIYAPVSGTVVAINTALTETPDLVNSDPYGEGWLFRIQPADDAELNELLDAETYSTQIAAEEH